MMLFNLFQQQYPLLNFIYFTYFVLMYENNTGALFILYLGFFR